VQETIQQIPQKHLTIWRADTNGQIGKIAAEEEKTRRIIGPYTKQKEAEKGNGKQVSKICYRENMIPTNTWETQPLTKKEKPYSKNTPNQH